MPFDPRLLAALGLILWSAPGVTGERRAAPERLCPENAPDGVRLPPRPGCTGPAERRALEEDGFRDVGGVKLRIGGRVGADYGVRSR